MTADLTYPDYRRGTFDALLDSYRCPEIRDGRRCQLYKNHHHNPEAAHAHEIAGHMHGRRYVEGKWWRWDETRIWEQKPGAERLAWCQMGAS